MANNDGNVPVVSMGTTGHCTTGLRHRQSSHNSRPSLQSTTLWQDRSMCHTLKLSKVPMVFNCGLKKRNYRNSGVKKTKTPLRQWSLLKGSIGMYKPMDGLTRKPTAILVWLFEGPPTFGWNP